MKEIILNRMDQHSDNRIEDELWTVKEASQYLKVSPKTIYKWIYSRKVTPIKVGGKLVRFKKKDVMQWFASDLKE